MLRGYITQEQHDRQLAALGVYRKQVRNRPRTRPDVQSFTLRHRDGTVVTHVGALKDFAVEHGMQRTSLGELLNGRVESYKGWRVVESMRHAVEDAA